MNDAPGDLPADESPRPGFRLKPREFAVDNPPAATPAREGVTDVREHFALAQAQPAAARPTPAAANEVQEILRGNVARASATGQNDVKPTHRRRSRRLRDYLLLTIGSTLLASVFTWLFGLSLIVFVLWVLIIVGLTWTMWFVMDDS